MFKVVVTGNASVSQWSTMPYFSNETVSLTVNITYDFQITGSVLLNIQLRLKQGMAGFGIVASQCFRKQLDELNMFNSETPNILC